MNRCAHVAHRAAERRTPVRSLALCAMASHFPRSAVARPPLLVAPRLATRHFGLQATSHQYVHSAENAYANSHEHSPKQSSFAAATPPAPSPATTAKAVRPGSASSLSAAAYLEKMSRAGLAVEPAAIGDFINRACDVKDFARAKSFFSILKEKGITVRFTTRSLICLTPYSPRNRPSRRCYSTCNSLSILAP